MACQLPGCIHVYKIHSGRHSSYSNYMLSRKAYYYIYDNYRRCLPLGERFKGSGAAAFLPMKISALERMIEIEPHGLRPGDMVPELARIHYVEFTGRRGSSDIRFSYCPVGMDGLVEIL